MRCNDTCPKSWSQRCVDHALTGVGVNVNRFVASGLESVGAGSSDNALDADASALQARPLPSPAQAARKALLL